MRRTPSKASLASPIEPSLSASDSSSASTSTVGPDGTPPLGGPPASVEYSPMPSMFQAAANAAALLERTPFAIDDAKDDEDETDDETDVEDDGVMDEVDAFLEAHDSGLTPAEREIAQGA